MHNAYEDERYQEVISEMKRALILLRQELGDTDEESVVMQRLLDDHLEMD